MAKHNLQTLIVFIPIYKIDSELPSRDLSYTWLPWLLIFHKSTYSFLEWQYSLVLYLWLFAFIFQSGLFLNYISAYFVDTYLPKQCYILYLTYLSQVFVRLLYTVFGYGGSSQLITVATPLRQVKYARHPISYIPFPLPIQSPANTEIECNCPKITLWFLF